MFEFIFTLVIGLICCLACAAIARGAGYPAGFFGLLGFLVGPGGVGLTLLSVSNLAQRVKAAGLSPASRDAASESAPIPEQAREDYSRMVAAYRPLRLALFILMPAAVAGGFYSVSLAAFAVLPTFVQLFEGMSLQLPGITQLLILATRGMRNPITAPFFMLLQLLIPVIFYFVWQVLARHLPGPAGFYRRTARVWLLTALGMTGGRTEGLKDYLPSEFHDLAGLPRPELEARFGPLQADVQFERESLLAASWTYNFSLMLMAATLAATPMAILVLGVFLPLYQLVGNLG